jgi:hypothetical protein
MALLVLPLGLALGSAATFGLSTSLQHLTSSRLNGTRTHNMLASLVRTPLSLAGMGMSVVAFVMHAIALSAGALVVVQPVIVTGVVFAVLIRAALGRRRPSRAEVGWAAVTWAGLATFLLGVGSPTVATGLPEHAAAAVVSLLGLSGLAALSARRCREGSVSKGLWLGVVSGVLFGLVAVLLKLVLPSTRRARNGRSASSNLMVCTPPVCLRGMCGQFPQVRLGLKVVPPVEFEPTLPPPEPDKTVRGRRRISTFPQVRSTIPRRLTTAHSGRFRLLCVPSVSRAPLFHGACRLLWIWVRP